jgi:hypothetical protein
MKSQNSSGQPTGGIKFGRYLSFIFSNTILPLEGCFSKIKLLMREFNDDTLDINDYPDITRIHTKYVNDYNSRTRYRPLNTLEDDGVVIFFFNQCAYSLYHAELETAPKRRKLFLELAKFMFRLAWFNLLRISIGKKAAEDPINRVYLSNIGNVETSTNIKNLRMYMIRKYMGAEPSTLNILYNKAKITPLFKRLTELEDYDDVIHEDYLLNWKETSDDFEECKVTPEGETPEEYKNHLHAFMQSNIWLSEDVHPSDIEMESWTSNSRCYSTLGSLKAVQRSEKLKLKDVLGRPFRYQRSVIQVSPANARDAWKPDPETLIQLKYYDYICKSIAERHPKSAMCSEEIFNKRLNRILNHKGRYAMIDIKKSGLTFPLYLIYATIDIVAQYIKVDPQKWKDSIKNTCVQDTDDVINPKRGLGLGMSNSLMTLVNCIISDTLGIDSLLFSDDSVHCVEGYEEIRALENFYDNIIDWKIKREKTILSDKIVFLEEYYLFEPEWYEKEQRDLMPIADFIFSENIWEVKEKLCGFARANWHLSKEFFRGILEFLVNMTGSEFSKEVNFDGPEKILPLELGGWEYNGFRITNPVVETFLNLNDYGKRKVNNVVKHYKKFNSSNRIKFKNHIAYADRKYTITSENAEAQKIIDELGFEQYYDTIDESMNSLDTSMAKNHRMRKVKGIKTSTRYKIWNNNVPQFLSSGPLLVENLIDSGFPRNFSLHESLIESISTIPSKNINGCIQRCVGNSTPEYEKAIAKLSFLNLPYKTNYMEYVPPENIPISGDIDIRSYNFEGKIPAIRNYSEDLLKEVSKLSPYPEVVLAEYCTKHQVQILDLKLKISKKYCLKNNEYIKKVYGSEKYEVEITPYVFTLSGHNFSIYNKARELIPSFSKTLRKLILHEENKPKVFLYLLKKLENLIITLENNRADIKFELEKNSNRYYILEEDLEDYFASDSEGSNISEESDDPLSYFD